MPIESLSSCIEKRLCTFFKLKYYDLCSVLLHTKLADKL